MLLPLKAFDPFPLYSRGERIADAVIHCAGLGAGVVGVVILFSLALPLVTTGTAAALAVYATGLLTMLSCSALYNLARRGTRKEVLRRFDHAAIFVMIAGTHTPFVASKIGGTTGFALLASVWTLGIAGIVLKLCWPRRGDGWAVLLYLGMSWSIVAAIGPLSAAVGLMVLALLLAGGIVYSLGVLFHLASRLRYHNAIWHAFVLAGAVCHYLAVLWAVVPGDQLG